MNSAIEYVTVHCGHTPDESGSYLLHEDQLIANLEESTGHGGLRSYGYTAF